MKQMLFGSPSGKQILMLCIISQWQILLQKMEQVRAKSILTMIKNPLVFDATENTEEG